MLAALDDLRFTLTLPRGDAVALYDRLAPRYERFHRRWLRRGGAESLAALQGCLAAELRRGIRVLDAGCGPGTLARWIAAQEPRAELTLLDAAPGMLERAAAIPGRLVEGDLLALPFATDEFDIVTSAWTIEVTGDPEQALAELRRVLAPGGLLCCCFCTEPESWNTRFRSLATRLAVEHLFGGRFLRAGFPAALSAGRTRRMRYHRGLSTFICYRKPMDGRCGDPLRPQGAEYLSRPPEETRAPPAETGMVLRRPERPATGMPRAAGLIGSRGATPVMGH